MSWHSRLMNVFRQRGVDEMLDDEIAFHIESRVDDLVKGGMAHDAARALARRQFGNRLRVRESSREARLASWADDAGRDVRHALRALRRTPVFAVAAILMLALGIGANTAILSVVNGVLLQPLPYPAPNRLMYLTTTGARPQFPVSVAEYLEFQQFNHSFEDVGAFRMNESNVMAGERPIHVWSAIVDAHLLKALGLRAVRGRLFTEADSVVASEPAPGSAPLTTPVAIISDSLWRSAFASQPVVGRLLEIDGRRLEVVGVMAPGADLMDRGIEVWLPLGFSAAERGARNNHNLTLIGRLKPDVIPHAAQREIAELTASWAARAFISPSEGHAGHVFAFVQAGSPGSGHTLSMTPLVDQVLGRSGRSIWILQAAVGLVLLIACANLANLLLARAETRQREFALLAALGARRGRLLRKVLAEGLLLSLMGGAVGVVLAGTGLSALVRAYPKSLPRIGEVAVDWHMMAAAAGLSVLCGVVFGLAPLMHLHAAAAEGLKASSFGHSGRRHLRRMLVVAEVALAVAVVAGTGLLLRTVRNLTDVDIGFDRSGLVTFSISLPRAAFDIPGRLQTYQRLLEELRAVPGVESASAMTALPLEREVLVNQTDVTGNATGAPVLGPDYQRVMSGFFETTRIPLIHGRAFQSTDTSPAAGVAIVNETMARSFWGRLDPIGQRLRPGGTEPWLTVVGVARDVKQTGVDQPVRPEVYVLVDQMSTPVLASFLSITPTTMHVVMRSTVSLTALAPAIRAAVRQVAPAVPVVGLRGMDEVFAESIRRPRLLADLLTLFSILALLLAAIGTYALLSSTVAERRREIGIRLALGAQRRRLLVEVLRQGFALIAVGIAGGMAIALGLNQALASQLFGVTPADPLTFAIALTVIAAFATLASWFPAWHASRLDPLTVLRAE